MLKKTALVLVVIGGLKWGRVGLFDLNVVSALLGEATALSRIVYGLVGLRALYVLMDVFKS